MAPTRLRSSGTSGAFGVEIWKLVSSMLSLGLGFEGLVVLKLISHLQYRWLHGILIHVESSFQNSIIKYMDLKKKYISSVNEMLLQ